MEGEFHCLLEMIGATNMLPLEGSNHILSDNTQGLGFTRYMKYSSVDCSSRGRNQDKFQQSPDNRAQHKTTSKRLDFMENFTIPNATEQTHHNELQDKRKQLDQPLKIPIPTTLFSTSELVCHNQLLTKEGNRDTRVKVRNQWYQKKKKKAKISEGESERRRRLNEWTLEEVKLLLQCTRDLVDHELKDVCETLFLKPGMERRRNINAQSSSAEVYRGAEKKLRRMGIFKNWKLRDNEEVIRNIDQKLAELSGDVMVLPG